VLSSVDGRLLPFPINMTTVNAFDGDYARARERLIVGYTRKQWGLEEKELDASVLRRVKSRQDRDDRYFTDKYQAMPLHGYTRLFERMLSHPNIKVLLKTSYRDLTGAVQFLREVDVIYTGPIDEYFEYRFGRLPYRSAEFRFETLDEEKHQPVGVINYPNEYDYTRVTEFKHLTGQRHQKTTIAYEYPCAVGDPFWPIPTNDSAERMRPYRELAAATKGVHFVGRLGSYCYYNMDQVVAQALALASDLVAQKGDQDGHESETERRRSHAPPAAAR
jgi:UDP-galactopyranose mutase